MFGNQLCQVAGGDEWQKLAETPKAMILMHDTQIKNYGVAVCLCTNLLKDTGDRHTALIIRSRVCIHCFIVLI